MASNGAESIAKEMEEFVPGYKNVAEYVQSGFEAVMASSRWSNTLSTAHTLADHSNTSSGYIKAASKIHTNAQSIFKTILALQKLSRNIVGTELESIAELNDELIDSLNKDLNVLDGVAPAFPEPIFNESPWKMAPVMSSITVGHVSMLAAHNVERPQISFKDAVDNSRKTLWQPRIVDKPNNIRPLAIYPIFGASGNEVGYSHPYEEELENFKPQAAWMSEGSGLLQMRSLEDTPFTLVQTLPHLKKLVKHLRTVKEIAVDVEHHNYRTFQGITCLLQISTEEGGDFLVDTLSLREHLHLLNEAFTNPKILKVLHGADLDVIWLQRDLGVYLVGLFDTHQAAILLEFSGLSLAALILRYCNIHMNKKYQLADWRIRPLPEELCEYARLDTHNLLYIWRRMKMDLLEKAQGMSNLLQAVFSKSRFICAKTYSKPVFHKNSYMDLYLKSRKNFNRRQLLALESVYQWRDMIARTEDESFGYVLPNHMLLQISESLPREMQGILACCNPIPPLVRRNLLTIHEMVLTARNTVVDDMAEDTAVTARVPLTGFAAIVLTHDKVYDSREGLPVYFKESHSFKIKRKKTYRKPNSLEHPPQTTKGHNINHIIRSFIPPYERCRNVKEFQNQVKEEESR